MAMERERAGSQSLLDASAASDTGQIDRMKSLMSTYYGVDDDAMSHGDEAPSPREVSRNSKDVNSSRFDPDAYIADVLRQCAPPGETARARCSDALFAKDQHSRSCSTATRLW